MKIRFKQTIMNKNISIHNSKRIPFSSTKFIDNDFNASVTPAVKSESVLGEPISPFLMNILKRDRRTKNILQESDSFV